MLPLIMNKMPQYSRIRCFKICVKENVLSCIHGSNKYNPGFATSRQFGRIQKYSRKKTQFEKNKNLHKIYMKLS